MPAGSTGLIQHGPSTRIETLLRTESPVHEIPFFCDGQLFQDANARVSSSLARAEQLTWRTAEAAGPARSASWRIKTIVWRKKQDLVVWHQLLERDLGANSALVVGAYLNSTTAARRISRWCGFVITPASERLISSPRARFDHTRFESLAWFQHARFDAQASFDGTQFTERLNFSRLILPENSDVLNQFATLEKQSLQGGRRRI
jgi:Pentapeptide repeats (9 copies)